MDKFEKIVAENNGYFVNGKVTLYTVDFLTKPQLRTQHNIISKLNKK